MVATSEPSITELAGDYHIPIVRIEGVPTGRFLIGCSSQKPV